MTTTTLHNTEMHVAQYLGDLATGATVNGLADDAAVEEKVLRRVLKALAASVRDKHPIEDSFAALVASWKRDTALSSSLIEMAIHPSYQKIISMGQPVVPLLLRELEREPDQWFWALKVITGEDPVPEEHRGNVDAMAADWIRWGREGGIEW